MTDDRIFVEATYDSQFLGNAADGIPVVLGAKFMVNETCWATHVKFRHTNAAAGDYRGGIFHQTTDDNPDGTGTGTLLMGHRSIPNQPSSAWVAAPIVPAIQCDPGIVYCVAVQSDQGRYRNTGGGFHDTQKNGANGIIFSPASGATPNPPNIGVIRNGVYDEEGVVVAGGLFFPRQVFNRAGYGIDVLVTDVNPNPSWPGGGSSKIVKARVGGAWVDAVRKVRSAGSWVTVGGEGGGGGELDERVEGVRLSWYPPFEGNAGLFSFGHIWSANEAITAWGTWWYYRPGGNTSVEARLYNPSTEAILASGTKTSGWVPYSWNFVPFTTPYSCAASTNYISSATVTGIHGYASTGELDSPRTDPLGIVTIPANGGRLNSGGAFPGSAWTGWHGAQLAFTVS